MVLQKTIILFFACSVGIVSADALIQSEIRDSDAIVYTKNKWNFELENDSSFTVYVALFQNIREERHVAQEREPLPGGKSFRAIIDTTQPVYLVLFSSSLANLSRFLSTGDAQGAFFEYTIDAKSKTVFLRLEGGQNFSELMVRPTHDARWFSGWRGGAGYTKSQLALDNNLLDSNISLGIPIFGKRVFPIKQIQQDQLSEKQQQSFSPESPISLQKKSRDVESKKLSQQDQRPIIVQEAQSVSGGRTITRSAEMTSTGFMSPTEERGSMASKKYQWDFELSNKSGVPILLKILDKNRRLIFQTEPPLESSDKVRIAALPTDVLYVLIRRSGTLGAHDVVRRIATNGKETIYLTLEKDDSVWILRPQKGGGFFGVEGETESGLDNKNNVKASEISNFREQDL